MKTYRNPLSKVALALLLSKAAFAETDKNPEVIYITSERIVVNKLDTPFSVIQISQQDIAEFNYRSLPEIFKNTPGVLIQKTSYGQGSPYIRGFTGFRTLFMIDGIRLNNATFREGPNQYWNTVDPFSLSKIELVRGASSALYGADAIGGTVQAFSPQLDVTSGEQSNTFAFGYRGATAERSNIINASFSNETNGFAYRVGGGYKSFGDLTRGNSIDQPNTGYDEYNIDGKLTIQFSPNWLLNAATFLTRQKDVPRTHKTVFSTSFAGTEIGDELQRDLSQKRHLTYAKLVGSSLSENISDAQITLSWHTQEESRKRLRSHERFDTQGVKTDTLGIQAQFTTKLEHTNLVYGADLYIDDVSSFSSTNMLQGPVADDSTYRWLGLFVQSRTALTKRLHILGGVRYTYIDVAANKISDPVTGNQLQLDKSWENIVGNLMVNYRIDRNQAVHGGISQGFRAPNLSDLTRFDSARSNEFEIPATELDPEHFTNLDIGYKYSSASFAMDLSGYYTLVRDQIERIPTGNQNTDGDFEITKENIGDGQVYGVELSLEYQFSAEFSVRGSFAYVNGKISTFPTSARVSSKEYASRLMPTSLQLGFRYDASNAPWWLSAATIIADKADRLSTRDQSDNQRIPPGGTPGYAVTNLTGGYRVSDNLGVNINIENILDKDYRVHGSGQNEAGRNFVMGLTGKF